MKGAQLGGCVSILNVRRKRLTSGCFRMRNGDDTLKAQTVGRMVEDYRNALHMVGYEAMYGCRFRRADCMQPTGRVIIPKIYIDTVYTCADDLSVYYIYMNHEPGAGGRRRSANRFSRQPAIAGCCLAGDSGIFGTTAVTYNKKREAAFASLFFRYFNSDS